MKTKIQLSTTRNYGMLMVFLLVSYLSSFKISAQVTFMDSTKVTNDAFYFWKESDPKPYHYGASINPHGNCVKVSNGYVFYTWYRGGWSNRALMVSRKKIGEGTWVHVALPAKLSLVGGKGDTHLTTNIGICPIDGTVHLMFDHHNEDLNYIRSKKNIAFAPDSEFTAENFLPQQNYLTPGKVVGGVTYPDLFNNDQGEMYFERRLGSAVGGDIVMTYYNGDTWSQETTIIKGRGAEVTQGERNFSYGSAHFINGKFYYTYSPRWAESPTVLGEGVYLMELGKRMDSKATNVAGKSFDLPIIDHSPFFIADPRSVPDNAGWAGGPQVAISPKNDIYMYIQPKKTTHYNYLKKAGETEFIEDRGKGGLGTFYGNRMYKFVTSGEDLVVNSCLAGSYEWREDFRMNVGARFRKSVKIMDNGTIVAVFSERIDSDKVPIYCYVLKIEKEDYIPQTISFEAIEEKTEGDTNFQLDATASSGLPVSYISTNTNIARIVNGNTVEIIGVGSCNIVASQVGNGVYDNAPDASQTLVVHANASKTNQTIQFELTSTTHVWGSPDQTLNAIASSGLVVQYESTNTNVAVVLEGKVHVKRAGKTTINALQLGDDTYNAAPIVGHELVVPLKEQEITFLEIPEVTSGDPAFQLQAKSNNPDANLRFLCPNNQVAIVWSNQVRQVLGAGSATITVSGAGNEFFTSAQTTQTIKVNPKTHIIPTDIEAEYYTTKSGVNITRWSNTVFYLNSWNIDDFAEYTIDVPEDGVYEIEVFAASPGSSKKLKVVSGSTKLADIALTVTPNLTVFKGSKANITLNKGVQKIKLVGVIGGFNFDRMKITKGQIVGGADGEGVYKLINVGTGKFLGAGVAGSQPVIMQDSGEGLDRKWEFVKTTVGGVDYYNIDSKDIGILRYTGAGFSAGAYLVVSTTKESPAGDTDKIWTIHYNETDNTFRFEAKSNGKFLYHDIDGNCYNISADADDARSKWKVEGHGGPLLNLKNQDMLVSSIKVYPNPAEASFILALNNLNTSHIKIYNILGKLVFETTTNEKNMQIVNRGQFTSGIYLIKVLTNNQKVFYTKLIIK
ncbi:BNR-4 repeat-containing protein [Algibacter lectus]|uniref:Putative secreted protein (Por secretion system target) n=1 Tax=Algibacter lectus TaxID=221126 RepID=A0A4R8MHS8_9FLAO|nr:BNR-4 repeat-containing protein [Algibacter lectus]MWW23165.1 T9SS type A sorting domain-containing protein [Algibacter lectus]TDY64157.1 putative secreted protein (Por secretion system target) [Algibacter lectus]